MSDFAPGNNPFGFEDVGIAKAADNGSQPQLVNMWRSAILKARQGLDESEKPRPTQDAALIINFDGAGSPIRVGMGGIPQIPPGSWRILSYHISAGIWNPSLLRLAPIICSATIELRLTHNGYWAGGSVPIYGDNGTPPFLNNQAEAYVNDLAGFAWLTDLQPGDLISYVLTSFTGTATVLTLTLALKRLYTTGSGETTVTDNTDTSLVDNSGHTIVLRNGV